MTDEELIAQSLIKEMNLLLSPGVGFNEYTHDEMYRYYENYLEFVVMLILEDSLLAYHTIDNDLFNLAEESKNKIQEFIEDLEQFYNRNEQKGDFTVLRDPYWEVIIRKTRETLAIFKEDLKSQGFNMDALNSLSQKNHENATPYNQKARCLIKLLERFANPDVGFARYLANEDDEKNTNYLTCLFSMLTSKKSIVLQAIAGNIFKLRTCTRQAMKSWLGEVECLCKKHRESNNFVLLQDSQWEVIINQAKEIITLVKVDLLVE